ncbi:MAG: sulfatase-like hydrolase/transferase, partial [Akkermansiaceae bacterium]
MHETMIAFVRKVFCVTLVAASSLISAAAVDRPNVLVILTDDQGSRDLGCYGAKDLATPAIDALAAGGVKLEGFYSAAPVCCPSRAGLLTGKHPWEVGVANNIGLSAEGMPSKHKTMAEYFREAGYTTAHIGKWHLGHHEDTLPNGQGFDFSFGHHGGCIDNYSHYFYWNGPNKHD